MEALDAETQAEVFMLIESGMVLGIGAAPVSSSMSRAITPSWRSASEPSDGPSNANLMTAMILLGLSRQCAYSAWRKLFTSWPRTRLPHSSGTFRRSLKWQGAGEWGFGQLTLTTTSLQGQKIFCPAVWLIRSSEEGRKSIGSHGLVLQRPTSMDWAWYLP